MITEAFRKRRAADVDEATSAVAKKAKTSSDVPHPSTSASFSKLDSLVEVTEAVSKSAGVVTKDTQPAAKGIEFGNWTRKENRSPNLSSAHGLQTDIDDADKACLHLEEEVDPQANQEAPAESEGLLNLLLLADSSLQDISDNHQEVASVSNNSEQRISNSSSSPDRSPALDRVHQQAECEDSQHSGKATTHYEGLEQQGMLETAPLKTTKTLRSSTGGLRPALSAQSASLMSVAINFDSDSSSDDEEEDAAPAPSSTGIGRYGQDLHKTATLALKQTVALKKKSINRTTKTVRQLRNAKDHSFEAAEQAVHATRAAELAVQRLAQFAGTFDSLVKEAVRAANAAAQLRADYAASVVAGDLAEAQKDRVISKRGKRRSASPKNSKKMSWAADEHLVQKRVYSTADPPSSASFPYIAAAALGTMPAQ